MAKKRTVKTARKRTKTGVAGARTSAAGKTVKRKVKKSTTKAAALKKKKTVKRTATKLTRKAAAKRVKKSARRPAPKATQKTAAAGTKTVRKAVAKRKPAAARRKPASPTVVKPAKPKKQKSGLTAKDIAELRSILLKKRDQLIGNVNNLHAQALPQNSAGDSSSMPIHMADIGSDNYEQEFTLGLIESERKLLKEIEDALQRMVDKTYGLCLGTGTPIGKKRLKASPWAKYSYEYKLAQEKGMLRRF